MCIGLRYKRTNEYTFSLQWHITAHCDQKCIHCYMYESPFYDSEIKNQLTLDDCKSIVDDFQYTLKSWAKQGFIFFTGGDPLLREDFFDILKYTFEKGIPPLAIAGNSYHLDLSTALKLKEYGVSMYQISIDGMKETHDSFRKSGSFDDAIRAIDILKKAGISPVCMFTLSKLNRHDLLNVIRLAAELELAAFDFDRLVPSGCSKNMEQAAIEAKEYRELLLEVREEYKRLISTGSKTQFGYKDNLWNLILNEDEKALINELVPTGFELKRGCLIGLAGMAILSDGNVMACRRLPVIVGKVPEQRIGDIFKNSPVLNELRNTKKIKKCSYCNNLDDCRGCRAVAYGCSNGDYYSEDPGCWL